jgi:hypothetical protein
VKFSNEVPLITDKDIAYCGVVCAHSCERPAMDFAMRYERCCNSGLLSYFVCLEAVRDSGERALDGPGKDAKHADHADRDNCQDDAVLGHRLTLFDGKPYAEVLDQI